MKLLTIKQAAAQIEMSVGWIKKAIRDKELDVVRLGRSVRIRPEDLEAYIVRKIEGTAQSLDRSLRVFAETPVQSLPSVTRHD